MKDKIVIVDDKSAIAKIVSIYLSKDYDFIYFDNPLKAIAWLNLGNFPDLIISDLRMPRMDGLEFVQYIKENDLFKKIPIIILSAENNSAMKIKLMEIGCDDHVVKPFNPLELKVRIQRLLP